MLRNNLHFLIFLYLITVSLSCGVKKSQKYKPDIESYVISKDKVEKINDTLLVKGNNSFRKNEYKQWELVASGNPLDMGNSIGDLTQEMIRKQEEVFLSKVENFVPSKFKQKVLRNILAWYNRNIMDYIIPEYQLEIYGISQFSSSNYDFIANKFVRSIYLHGAHDIGHAFKDLALVGCTSFAVWGENTLDGKLLIARNFDFYVNDKFAEDKVISFIHPDKGNKFVSISWAGMIGVMSGMNEKGLTVTINAGKSDVPYMAKTPISLVAREILQYATNLKEAVEIAKQKEVFVSESILVGSDYDNKAIIIEISPNNFGVYQVENSSKIVCSNHFQSKAYQFDKKNKAHIANSDSNYRYKRMEELLNENQMISPEKAVSILRNKDGLANDKIGLGNEKSINQLISHHGVVFQPHDRLIWISANPYQLGEFVAFQLDSVFANSNETSSTLSIPKLLIAKDPFVDSDSFKNYEKYKLEKIEIEELIETNGNIPSNKFTELQTLNPNSWEVYYLAGIYYFKKKYYQAALTEFNNAKTHEITTEADKIRIEDYIRKINRKLD